MKVDRSGGALTWGWIWAHPCNDSGRYSGVPPRLRQPAVRLKAPPWGRLPGSLSDATTDLLYNLRQDNSTLWSSISFPGKRG